MIEVSLSLCGWCGGSGESQSSWQKPCPHCDGEGIEYYVDSDEFQIQSVILLNDEFDEFDEIPF